MQFEAMLIYRPRAAIRRKQKQLWASGDWQYSCTYFMSGTEFFGKPLHYTVALSTLQSWFAFLVDFCLFPEVRPPLKGKRFQTVNENVIRQLKSILKEDFIDFLRSGRDAEKSG